MRAWISAHRLRLAIAIPSGIVAIITAPVLLQQDVPEGLRAWRNWLAEVGGETLQSAVVVGAAVLFLGSTIGPRLIQLFRSGEAASTTPSHSTRAGWEARSEYLEVGILLEVASTNGEVAKGWRCDVVFPSGKVFTSDSKTYFFGGASEATAEYNMNFPSQFAKSPPTLEVGTYEVRWYGELAGREFLQVHPVLLAAGSFTYPEPQPPPDHYLQLTSFLQRMEALSTDLRIACQRQRDSQSPAERKEIQEAAWEGFKLLNNEVTDYIKTNLPHELSRYVTKFGLQQPPLLDCGQKSNIWWFYRENDYAMQRVEELVRKYSN